MHEYSINVKNRIIKDPSFMGIIFAADEKDDWTKEETWRKANPNLGVSVRIDYLRSECEKAIRSPSYENVFKRLHLNIWTEQDSRWIPISEWDACKGKFELEEMKGLICWAGVDLASTTDIGAMCLVFPPSEKFPKWRVFPKFYLPKKAIQVRKERDRIPYDDWERQGLIQVNDGAILDYGMIEQDVVKISNDYNLKEIVLDPWNAVYLATRLEEQGFKVEFWRQGYPSLNAPTKFINELIASRGIEHDSNPILRWMASNIAIEQDPAGNIKPSKRKSKEKIDGIVAIINALGRAMKAKDNSSVYENKGLTVL
jgi:phage terminase large subunit-like protein